MRSAHSGFRLLNFGVGLILIFSTHLVSAQQSVAQQQTAAALSRAQGLLRQIAEQKASLESENAKLNVQAANTNKALRDAQARIESLKLDLDSSDRQNVATSNTLSRVQERLEKTTTRLTEYVEKLKVTLQTLQQTESEKQQFEADLGAVTVELEDAETKNIALYAANVELMKLYKSKTALDGLLQREPFTGIKNVEVETVLEEFEYKMYDELRSANLEKARSISSD